MLVRARELHDGGDVHAAFVSEGAAADVRAAVDGVEVGHFVYETRDIGKMAELLGLDAVVAELQLKSRDDTRQIRVAAAFAQAVDGALNMPHTGANRVDTVGYRAPAIVVGVDAQRDRTSTRLTSIHVA